MSGLRQPGLQRELVAAAASVTITPGDAGKTFHTTGATGTITLTFQSAALFQPGDSIHVLAVADQTLTLAFTAGQLITFNNGAATSVSLQTSSEKIGGGFILTCLTSSKWHCLVLCEETQTVTVA